ncbi:armadillo-like helical domain-containing protein 4 isoform X1 [Cervus canadensis]|uniref:armadillo-like helical domain-containing protein 4 isoform X1 n=1 Tax=Cervus canadensis TaxID=1574408 RepID=UPI001C9E857E|nr:armadillo-like helical domain-containing protein 4 isoform X1 [Cervus canadensis]XP_043328121.1 armadillo-like helical domain-containing protein 4 isoform X1 [Cervus canadensis]
MSRPIVLHICLAFCSLLLLNFAIQCLAFPNVERREIVLLHAEKGQSERLNTDDLENDSVTSKYTPVSGDPMIVLAGSSAMSLNKVFPSNKETPPVGAGLMRADGSNIYTATEPEVPAREEVFGSSQPERMSPQSRPSKATLTNPVTPTASLNIDEREESSRGTIIQPTVERTTEATQGFLSYVDDQLFATESPEGLSLGHSPLSLVNTKEMLTTSPRTEKFEANPEHKTTSFPGSKLTAGTESSQMTADNTQATAATKPRLPTSESILSVDPEADSLLGAPAVTMSVSTAVAAAPVVSDEWDDTRLDSVSQIKTPELGDSTETQVRLEISQTTQAADVSLEGMEGGEASTEAADVSLKLPEMETHMETTLPMARGGERASDQSSFTPTSPIEGDPKASVMNLVQETADFVESTKENSAMFLETTVSISEYESEVHQPLGNRFKDIVTQEMTTAVQAAEAAVSLVTQDQQVSPLEVTRGEDETGGGRELPSATADGPHVTQLSRRWEPLATVVSTTPIPVSFEVTPAVEDLMDTVTGPNEELFTPILGSPVTPPGIMEEAPSTSPALADPEASSERRTAAPSFSYVNTATSYGLDQLESEEGEDDEDEEDEEEEDEEEEDEEEDEEDKDADSLDETLGDTELPGFTLPGITSQEPGLEQENVVSLEGVTFQVPDAIQWEQQNQGLVRSWMEKLKDKAGYMSGMLVPVGVGIAGALFILGALYSIKVMNRRRRNGFKRHKRKQREFNSMQDRVMLLADSSEDEF